jgi:NAD(P)H-hydrate epimerase
MADAMTTNLSDRALAALLPPLAHDAHKYTRGSLLVLAGSARFPGAAVLAAQAAGRVGAGYVTLAVPEPVVLVAQTHLLSTPVLATPATNGAFAADAWEALHAQLTHIDAIVLGPGLTVTPSTSAFVESVLQDGADDNKNDKGNDKIEPTPLSSPPPLSPACPLLLDADALNLFAALITHGFKQGSNTNSTGDSKSTSDPASSSRLILTPHAGELARLLRATKATSAHELAVRLNAVVVAKGPETLIVSPTRSHLFTAGTPALATAGTGDVLAGIIGSFAAQGAAPFDAAVLGVELHGRVGHLAAQRLGQRSVRPEDLIATLPPTLRHISS